MSGSRAGLNKPILLVAVLAGAAALATSHYLMYRFGVNRGRAQIESRIYGRQHHKIAWLNAGRAIDDVFRRLGTDIGVSRALGASTYHSQIGQDQWVLQGVFPGVRDGYFVDIGSADGMYLSNTKSLEDRGWTGVCIDPFPTNVESRTCDVIPEVVYSSSGQVLSFRQAGVLGGIQDHLNRYASDKSVQNAALIEFTTTTMNEVLESAQAPTFLHYVSLDVEGAEYEVLQGFDLGKYQVGAFTIEHNFEEPKRTQIRELLERHGYRIALSIQFDDWYLPVEKHN
jgi:FkbM family methyltransferase